MAWTVREDGRPPVECATIEDVRQYVEDRAVEMWAALRNPNAAEMQTYPGLVWSRNAAQAPMVIVARLDDERMRVNWEAAYVNN